jgi:hypothetical protein
LVLPIPDSVSDFIRRDKVSDYRRIVVHLGRPRQPRAFSYYAILDLAKD